MRQNFMIDEGIDSETKLKILNLTPHDLSGYHSEEFIGNEGKILNYVFNNLNCFHTDFVLNVEQSNEEHLYHWEVINDPVLPYIIGITPTQYQKIVGMNGKGYITLYHYFDLEGEEEWRLTLFGGLY